MKKKEMSIGRLTIEEKWNIPVLEILLDGEVYGYMTPFRGYFFQISRTYDGQHDLGRSSNSCNLYNFLNKKSEVERDMFDVLAVSAIYKAARIYQDLAEETLIDCKIDFRWLDKDKTWEKFISCSVDWVRQNKR